MSEFQIRDFEVFEAVAETGNFSAAARKLGCTPSAVSKLIGRIEARLGSRLVQRTSRALALTHDGRAFRQAASHVLNAIAEADSLVGDATAPGAGTLRVHTTLNFAQHQIAPLLPTFVGRYPAIRLEFYLTSDPVDLLEAEVDISVQAGPLRDSSLVARRLTTSRRMICAAPGYLASRGTPVRPADLASHACLNFFHSSPHSVWPMMVGEEMRQVAVPGTILSNSDNFLRVLACHGLGIVRLSEFHVADDLVDGRLIPVLEQFQLGQPEQVYAVFQSRRHLGARVRTFLSFLESHLRQPA